jgi:hypothetical protein
MSRTRAETNRGGTGGVVDPLRFLQQASHVQSRSFAKCANEWDTQKLLHRFENGIAGPECFQRGCDENPGSEYLLVQISCKQVHSQPSPLLLNDGHPELTFNVVTDE